MRQQTNHLHRVFLLATVFVLPLPLLPQEMQSKLPTVIYTFEFKGTRPEWFRISVDSSAKAVYLSRDKLEDDPDAALDFKVSEVTREKIFDLTKQANYFEGSFDFTKHKIANTGNKRLAYSDEAKSHETTFVWSENPAIQELSKLFFALGATQQFGKTLNFKRRFDPLGLDADLRRMQELQKEGDLAELSSIAPVLRMIANDPAVLKIARARAKALLDKGE